MPNFSLRLESAEGVTEADAVVADVVLSVGGAGGVAGE